MIYIEQRKSSEWLVSDDNGRLLIANSHTRVLKFVEHLLTTNDLDVLRNGRVKNCPVCDEQEAP